MSKLCDNAKCGNDCALEAYYCSEKCYNEDAPVREEQAKARETHLNEQIQVNTVDVQINLVDVQKVSLNPGDTLMVTIKHDEITRGTLEMFSRQFKKLFPNNQVFAFNVGTDGDVKFAVVSKPEVDYTPGCGTSPTSYCNDCNCGKKELAEGK
jgi:hypothetical protein